MTPARLLDLAAAAGVRIEPHGDRLRLRAPEKPTDKLLALLRENKPAILDHLRDAAAIGNVRPPEPHRRCPSCGSGLQPTDVDLALCFTCRSWFERVAPRRPQ